VTALGPDAFGDAFLDLWRKEGVDTSAVIRDPEAHTGVYFVSHGEKGHVFSYLRAGSAASRLGPDRLPRDYIASAQYLHVSGISQAISSSACDAVFAAIDAARGAGRKVSFDTNLRLKLWPLERARAIIHATIPRCDVILPSMEDAAALTGIEDPDAIVDFYLGLGVPLAVLKMGRDGALVATAGERWRVPGRSVATVDATGAGDTFDGAFLSMLVRGEGPLQAATYANAAAALSTCGYGAVAPIPTRSEVLDFMSREEPQ
jgi:2-dehydro-3-deoxygluconokinase